MRRPHITSVLETVSPGVACGLVESLFAEQSVLTLAVFVQAIAGSLAFSRTGAWWLIGWAALSVPLALVRGRIAHAYRKREGSTDIARWVRDYTIGAWMFAANWGAASLTIVLEQDEATQSFMIICQVGVVAAACVRNAAVKPLVYGQMLLIMSPIVVLSLVQGGAYHNAMALLVAVMMAAGRRVIAQCHLQLFESLRATEETAEMAVRLAEANLALEENNHALEEMVTTDALTGVMNRRGFDVRLQQEWQRARRDRAPMSLLLLDIDQFKLFNDHYGHPQGDLCLHETAQAMLEATRRPGDLSARYGGEEFAVILPGTDEFGAWFVAERIRIAVERRAIAHAPAPMGRVTVSIGCATSWPEAPLFPDELVCAADAALYRAKAQGRNCVAPSLPAVPRIAHAGHEPGVPAINDVGA